MTKNTRETNLEKRRRIVASAIPEVRKLVSKYDLAAVQSAVRSLYENRKAERALKDAEKRVDELRRKLK